MADNNLSYGVPTVNIWKKILCWNITIVYDEILVYHYHTHISLR